MDKVEKTGAEEGRGIRKTRSGVVVSNKAAKTVTVQVTSKVMHSRYKKYVTKKVKFLAHDEKGECGLGDVVEVVDGRPISRHKSWRVTKIVSKAV
jgi:small subunit ribosomal protein S17